MILAKKKLIDSEPSLWLSNQNMRELFFLFFSSRGDCQKWFYYKKISWSNESEIDPGKLLGPKVLSVQS